MNSQSSSLTNHCDQSVSESNGYLVSAIVSTYNAERFIRGKLEDLQAQTIADRLEIIVVDSGSRQNERAVVEEFQKRYSNIKYIRTEQRETVYQAWNRGIKAATGAFITNANTDDRLKDDCIELLVQALDENPDKVLAYGDSIVTLRDNETFNHCTPHDNLRWPDFDRNRLLEFCYVGPHPVWRREVHDAVGYFDERYQCAADYEFWLRLALHYEFVHIAEPLGLYWLNEGTVSRKGDLPVREAVHIQQSYRRQFTQLRQSVPHKAATSSTTGMSVLLVTHDFPPASYGGVEVYVHAMATELRARGCTVAVFHPVPARQGSACSIETELREGITLYKLSVAPEDLSASIAHPAKENAFREFLASHNFDVVHFHHTHMKLPLTLMGIAKEVGYPVIITLHDFWLLCIKTHLYRDQEHSVCKGPDSVEKCRQCWFGAAGDGPGHEQRARFEQLLTLRNGYARHLLSTVDVVAAPSRFVADTFERYGYGNGNIAVMPLGIRPMPYNPGKTRDKLTFGYMGTIHEIKNVFALVEAFSATTGDARLVLRGGGQPDRIARLSALIRDDRIEYLGSYTPEQLPEILAGIDILVVPSLIESYCFTVREALSAGIPVLAANVGGIPEIVTDRVNGILFDPSDNRALQRIIQYIFDNPDSLGALTKTGTPVKSITDDASEWLHRYRKLAGNSAAVKYASDRPPEAPQPTTDSLRLNNSSAKALAPSLKVAVYSLDHPLHACARIRALAPGEFLADAMELKWGVQPGTDRTTVDTSLARWADLIIVQRFFPTTATAHLLEQILASGKPVIYETDDLLVEVPSSNPHQRGAEAAKPFILDLISKAAAVTVSTDEMQRAFAPYHRNIHVLPNLLDDRLWIAPLPTRLKSAPVVIGYAGTPDHKADLELLEEILERVAAKYGSRVVFRFMGCDTEHIRRLPGFSALTFEPGYENYARTIQKAGIDIGLVPLADNRFNRCKSNIKWLEYSACGIAGIYADLPPYRSCVKDGETGILVQGYEVRTWVAALEDLIENTDRRHAIASAARAEVLASFTLKSRGHRYLDTWREIAAGHTKDKELGMTISQQPAVTDTSPSESGTPPVSIIIPLFNKLEYTRQCLEALVLNTDPKPGYEIILVDNASTDDTSTYLQSLQGDITVISNKTNLGFAKACNQGARLATGRYLIFLNNDTVPHPGWLDALVRGSEEDGADIVGAKLLYPNGRIQHAGVAFDEQSIGYHIFNGFPADAPAVNRKRFMQCVTAACMLVKGEVFQELNGFDEGYRNGFEDVDLCLRAGISGKRILYTPESVLIHFEETSEGRKTHEQQNIQRYLTRWGGKVFSDDGEIYRSEGYAKETLADGRHRIRQLAEAPAAGYGNGTKVVNMRHQPAAPSAISDHQVDDLLKQGNSLTEAGKLDEALSCFETVAKLRPDNPGALIGMGVVNLLQSEWTKAAVAFSRALRQEPANSKALCGLAMTRNAQGRCNEAFECYGKALDTDPENLTALHELVRLAYATNSFSEAAVRLETYLMYHPGNPDMLFSFAGILFKSGAYGKAQDNLERLLTLSPDYEGANQLLVKLCEAKKLQYDDETLAPKPKPIYDEAGKFKEEGKFIEALAVYSRIAEHGDRSVLADIGDCLANLGRLDDAAATYQEALKENGNDPKTLVGLGVVSMLQGKQVKAVTWFNRALKSEENDSRALCGLGMVRNLQNKHNEAIELFARALDADPEQLSALNGLVGCSYQLGKFEEAERRLDDYLMYHPADLDMLFSLAGIRYKMGNQAAALDSIEKVLLFAPGYQGGRELMDKIREQSAA